MSKEMKGKAPDDVELTYERLLEAVHYYPDTGIFIKSKTQGTSFEKRAGTETDRGFRVIRIDGIRYKETHLAWFFMNGSMPPKGMAIYHKNGNVFDNTWSNLTLNKEEQGRPRSYDIQTATEKAIIEEFEQRDKETQEETYAKARELREKNKPKPYKHGK